MSEIKHTTDGLNGSFDYVVEGQNLAGMFYRMTGDLQITIDHTEVDESLKGRGIGRDLLESLVEYARTENLKVIPMCSFARVTFERVEEWRDVLKS